jgi:spore coat polysaccharide biosynthesis protein SpsF
MTVLCVVQARTGSTRLPGKVLQDVGGRPMLRFMLDRLATLRVDELVVATSELGRDDPVADVAAGAGRPVVRGPEDDVLARYALALEKFPADHVVRLTADCPLSDPRLVEHVVAVHLARRADYTANVFPRTYPKGLDVEVMRAGALRAAATRAEDAVEREHVTPYLYRRPECFTLANARHGVHYGDERWTVDTADDLEAVRHLVARMGDAFGWEDAIRAVGRSAPPPAGAVHLAPAMPEDRDFVLACRRDADAVRWSRAGRAIAPEEHARWFTAALANPAIRLRTARVDGERVGTVRVDVRGGGGEVGIAVVSHRRGQGLARALLGALVADCASDPQVVDLVACVHPENERSLRAFAAAGFVPAGGRDGFRVLRRPVARPIGEA